MEPNKSYNGQEELIARICNESINRFPQLRFEVIFRLPIKNVTDSILLQSRISNLPKQSLISKSRIFDANSNDSLIVLFHSGNELSITSLKQKTDEVAFAVADKINPTMTVTVVAKQSRPFIVSALGSPDIIDNKMITILAPYSQIKIEALSQEAGLTSSETLTLVKRLIVEGRIRGRIDMVNNTVVLDQNQMTSIQNDITLDEEKHRRSSAWYLVPILFSIIGGLIGYFAVKDDDKGMANNLLGIGIVMFFIYLIIYLARL